jgi:hypothetical protein
VSKGRQKARMLSGRHMIMSIGPYKKEYLELSTYELELTSPT